VLTAFLATLGFGLLTLCFPQRWVLSAFQVVLFGLALARAARRARTGFSWNHALPACLLAAAALWAVLQGAAGWSIERERTFEAALDWCVNAAAFALALDLTSDVKTCSTFLRASLIFATLLSIVAVFTLLTSRPGFAYWWFDTGSGVPTLGPFVYKNQYAAFVEAVLPMAVAGAILDPKRCLVFTLAAALLFGSVVAAGSRAGAILCLALILIIPAIALAQKLLSARAALRTVAASLAAVVLFTAIVGWQSLWNRLQEPNPYALRRDLNISSIAMFRDHVWTGSGLGTWSTAYPQYARFDDGTFVNQAHNDWLQWASEGGIPFLLLMLAFAAIMLRPAWRTLWGVGMVAVFTHAFVDYPFQQRPALAAFFFALAGVLWRATHPPESNLHPRP